MYTEKAFEGNLVSLVCGRRTVVVVMVMVLDCFGDRSRGGVMGGLEKSIGSPPQINDIDNDTRVLTLCVSMQPGILFVERTKCTNHLEEFWRLYSALPSI